MSNEDERTIRIEDKVDKITEHLMDIKVTLGQQHVTLVEHSRRTAALEQMVIPMHNSRQRWIGVSKFIGLLALLGGIIESVKALLRK